MAEKRLQRAALDRSLVVALPKGARERVWVEHDASGQHYYGTSTRKIPGPVTLQVEIVTGHGRPDEQRRARTLRLAVAKEVVEVGEVVFGTPR